MDDLSFCDMMVVSLIFVLLFGAVLAAIIFLLGAIWFLI